VKKIKLDLLDECFIEKLNNSKFYKLDFGFDKLNNKSDFYTLIYFATLAGFSVIDICPKEEFIKLALDAINDAKEKSFELKINSNLNTLLFSSFGINSLSEFSNKMICKEIHGVDIHFDEVDFLRNLGNIEFVCNSFKDKIISCNLSRKKLSNAQLIDLLEKCFQFSKRKLIIEVEGMNFYEIGYKNNLQTISTADIINKQFRQKSYKYQYVPLILGNCSNENLTRFAFNCNVPFNGVSVNYTFFKKFLTKKSFSYSNEEIKNVLKEIKLILMKDN